MADAEGAPVDGLDVLAAAAAARVHIYDVDEVFRLASQHGLAAQVSSVAAGDIVDLSQRLAKLKTLHGITLLVDSREHALADLLRLQPWVRVESLPCCDFLFVDCEGRPLVGYERKAQADLVQSIKNNTNHYRDQKRRMLELGARVLNVVLEGSSTQNRMFELNCESKTVLRDGMGWRRTMGQLDTLRMLLRDALAIFELGPDALAQPEPQAPHETFQGLARKDAKLQFVRMLCCVPGFSGNKAKVLADAYGSMQQLLACFDDGGIADLQYQASAGAEPRRIGPASAAKLRAALFSGSDTPPHLPPKKPKSSKSKSKSKPRAQSKEGQATKKRKTAAE